MGDTEQMVYKTIGDAKLKVHIFMPHNPDAPARVPAIVFFFGGGWVGGNPSQFFQHCRHFASRGMVAMSAEYRVQSRHGTTPFECVKDGKSAVRWVRTHATDLGIDPERIVAAGGSAGGHVAACTATIEGLDEEGEDLSIGSSPNAMLLFNPVIDTGKSGFGADRLGERPEQISPVHHVREGLPPTLIFHGTADRTVPFENLERFHRLMCEAGNRCELVPFDGKEHGFFNYGRDGNAPYDRTIELADAFFSELGYLDGQVP